MGSKILVVDDEWSMRELLRNVLVLHGFEPIFASSGDEFRQMAFNENVDAIILDIMLGKEDGTEVYNELVENGLSRNIPVVFLSALAQDRPPKFPAKGRRYSLVGKPFDPEEFVGKLRESILNMGA